MGDARTDGARPDGTGGTDGAGRDPPVASPWAQEPDAILASLEVDPGRGLTEGEVARRRERWGANRLRQARRRSALAILVAQFRSLLVALLAAAAVLSAAFGQWVEAIAVLVVLVLNAAIGFVTELRAVRSMEALRRLGSVKATVRRDGHLRVVGADELVPGDLLVVEGGDVVTADVRLLETSKLQANESALTGESLPVGKHAGTLSADAPLPERPNMLFKGTALTRGSAEGVVVATGMDTELGRISRLVEEAGDETTPLEQRLDALGQRLVWVTLAVATLVALTGVFGGKPLLLILETAIALAVATVPEGLPIIATITLARGMRRMAERNALINRLSAVETLGATSVIFSDKTGTLTENRMSVASLWLDQGQVTVGAGGFRSGEEALDPAHAPRLREALEAGALCNNASWSDDGGVGDPMEVALLEAATRAGVHREALLRRHPEVREEAFDADVKMMGTVHEQDGGYRAAVKGAPEAVLEACARVAGPDGLEPLDGDARERWSARNRQLAERGLRVLALAARQMDAPEGELYRDLTLLGLVAMRDPPREDVRAALAGCRRAGIRVVMVTGDQPVTAVRIADAVGLTEGEPRVVAGREMGDLLQADDGRRRLLDADILARVSPEQKLQLIDLHQRRGAIVAMTGDGVNDAPALKKADIGVAMGRRGTEVAREAADMVLKDDAFGTIVEAVRQGRIIFDNIRAFVLYLLSCNLSEILVIGLASALGAPLPLLPLQILFLNLVTDVFPALALGAGEGDAGILRRPPRDPAEPVLAARHWRSIGAYAGLITAAVLGAFALALGPLGMPRGEAVTVSFLTLAFAQLWHVFDMREPGTPLVRNEITRNPWVWGALALCTALLLLAVAVPGAREVLQVVPLEGRAWLLVAGASLLPTALGQLGKALGWGRVA